MEERMGGTPPREESPSKDHHPVVSPNVEELIAREAPAALDAIPPEVKRRLSLTRVEAQLTARSGPLPPASELAEYCKHIPDGGDRIMRLAENQAEHRLEIEKRAVTSQLLESSRGQWFAFLITLFGIGATCWLSGTDHPAVAGVLGTGTFGNIIVAFILGKSGILKSLAAKRRSSSRNPSPSD